MRISRTKAFYWLFSLFVNGTIGNYAFTQDERELSQPFAERIIEIEEKLEEIRDSGQTEKANVQAEALQNLLENFEDKLDKLLSENLEEGKSPLENHLALTRKEIEKLRAAGQAELADKMLQRLQPLELADRTGQFEFESSQEPELHQISLQQGSTLPKEFAKGNNRLHLGFAEVDVRYTARPVILALECEAPVMWKK